MSRTISRKTKNYHDFNAKIEKEKIYGLTIEKDSLHNDTNDNRNKLITFATVGNIAISNKMIPYKIFINTWISSYRKAKNQIDHVVMDYRIKSNVKM